MRPLGPVLEAACLSYWLAGCLAIAAVHALGSRLPVALRLELTTWGKLRSHPSRWNVPKR
jgi:hypothetical protein